MPRNEHPFKAESDKELLQLVRDQPLAWIVSGTGTSFRASLMPVRPWKVENGGILQFASHLPRANDQVTHLRKKPDAHLLFLGPNTYVSGAWVDDPRWTPTWNFTSANFRVEIEFRDDPRALRAILEDLVGAMESGRDNAWRIEDMGDRYHELSRRIVGFVAHVVDVEERFKLGQDERPEVFDQILEGLESEGRDDVKAWMERFGR